MSIFEENLKALSAVYPQMDQLIKEAKEKIEPEIEIIEETSYSGERIIKIKKEDRICYLNGKRNIEEPAQIWVESVGHLATNSPVFIMGLGNPNYLKKLVEGMENRIAIIIYEPSFQIFLDFLEHVPLQRWMEKHLMVFWVKGLEGLDDKAMDGIIKRILRYETLRHYRKLILPNYDVLFPEEAVSFLRMINQVTKDVTVNYLTQMRFANVSITNLLDNVKYLCDGFKTTQLVEVIPNDIPGIVVAAGPSLNKNIQELKKAKGKALIIAVDTAIKPLLAAGIIPDMFTIVDGKKPLDLVQKESAKEIPLVAAINANSEILKYHTGMKFFYNESYAIAEQILVRADRQYGGVDTGGSVATSAFSLLYKIGLTRIILVGQDLAFTGNRSHADGTFEKVMKEENTAGFIMVEGNVEKEVPTTASLKIYLDWYDKYIEDILEREKGCFRVINATEGGAKIKNTEIMTLHDAIEKECTKEVDIQECLGRLSPMLDEESRKWAVEYLDDIPDKFFQLAADAKKAKKLYGKLDKVCNKRNMDSKEYLSVLKKIEKSIKKIESNSVVYQLVNETMVGQRYVLLAEQFEHEDSVQAEGKEMAREGMIYTKYISEIAELFGEYMKELREKESLEEK